MDENKRTKLEWTDTPPATAGRQPEGNKAELTEGEGQVIDVRRVAPA
jgi:hypothetical protein